MISTLFRIILHRLLSFIEQDFRNKISFSFDLGLIRSTRSTGQILSDYARSVSGSGIDFRPGSLMIIEHVPPSLSSSFPPSFRFFVGPALSNESRNFLLGGNSTWMENPDTTVSKQDSFKALLSRVAVNRVRFFSRNGRQDIETRVDI